MSIMFDDMAKGLSGFLIDQKSWESQGPPVQNFEGPKFKIKSPKIYLIVESDFNSQRVFFKF